MAVELWTDGACSGNPGPGGWACVLRYRDAEKELSDGEAVSTNNRMELLAVIRGLQALTRPAEVVVHLDSTYVMNAIHQGLDLPAGSETAGRPAPSSRSPTASSGWS